MFDMDDSEYERKFASQDEIQARESFENLKPFLKRRIQYFVDSGRKYECRKEVESMTFYLEVMKDPLMIRTHGVAQIRNFVSEIYTMEHKNPIPNDWKPKNSRRPETGSKSSSSTHHYSNWDETKVREFEAWKKSSESQSWEEQNTSRQPSSSSATRRNPAREEHTRSEHDYQRSSTSSSVPIEKDFNELFERRPRARQDSPRTSRSEQRREFLPREQSGSETGYFFDTTPPQRVAPQPRSESYQRSGSGNQLTYQQVYPEHQRQPPVVQQAPPGQMLYNYAPQFPNNPPHFTNYPPQFANYPSQFPSYQPTPVPMYFAPTPTFMAVPMPYYGAPTLNIPPPPLNQYNPQPQRDSRQSSHQHHSRSSTVTHREYPPRHGDNSPRIPPRHGVNSPRIPPRHGVNSPRIPPRHGVNSPRIPPRHGDNSPRIPPQSHRSPAAATTTLPASPPPTSTYDKIMEITRRKAQKCFENRDWKNRKIRSSLSSKSETSPAHPSTSKTTEVEARKRNDTKQIEPSVVPEKRKKLETPVTQPSTSTTAPATSSVDSEPELEVIGEFEYGTTKINEKAKEIKREQAKFVNELSASIFTLMESQKRNTSTPNELIIPENRKNVDKPTSDICLTATASSSTEPEVVLTRELNEVTNESQNARPDENQQEVEPTGEQEIVTENSQDSNEIQQHSTEVEDHDDNCPLITTLNCGVPDIELNNDVNNVHTECEEVQNVIEIEFQEEVTDITEDSSGSQEQLQDMSENEEDVTEFEEQSSIIIVSCRTVIQEETIEVPSFKETIIHASASDSISVVLEEITTPELNEAVTQVQTETPQIPSEIAEENQQDSTETRQETSEGQEDDHEGWVILPEMSNSNETQQNDYLEVLVQNENDVVSNNEIPSSEPSSETNPSQPGSSATSSKQGKRGHSKRKTTPEEASNGESSSASQPSSSSNPGEQKRYNLRSAGKMKKENEAKIISRMIGIVLDDELQDEESRKKLWEKSLKKFKVKTLKNGKQFIGANDFGACAGLRKIKVEADYIPPENLKVEPNSEVVEEDEDISDF